MLEEKKKNISGSKKPWRTKTVEKKSEIDDMSIFQEYENKRKKSKIDDIYILHDIYTFEKYENKRKKSKIDDISILNDIYIFEEYENKKFKNESKIKKEIWKSFPVELFKDKYEVSNRGRIQNMESKYILKPILRNGYHYCSLSTKGKNRSYRTHRIVAEAFVKNPDKKKNKIVNHLDGNRLNNYYKNLEWTTIKGNNEHAAQNNLTAKTERRVSQFDENNKLIKIHDTLSKASEETGVGAPRIVDVCKGRWKTAGGFIWKYTDENENEVDLDPEEEGFKQIKTFPNYWVTKDGRIYSKPFKKFMKLNKHKMGCLQIQLTKRKPKGEKGQIKKTVLMHNLVAMYHLPKPENINVNCVRHKNGDKTNNNVENLEWSYTKGGYPDLTI
ncbi:MAG: DNA-directed RNA polymerase subunit 2 [Satyrvirus sp.]|uniref:DNA-directed RNA polymerase subunit 2 n=1 Tax=Satyrvirus sp. TaxID=2487771 RepID=A0A3G5AEB6_9VIRU|nr:MAG: DNA-directed RNA polymerase subunit 2 [Satyrvirus sp.]